MAISVSSAAVTSFCLTSSASPRPSYFTYSENCMFVPNFRSLEINQRLTACHGKRAVWRPNGTFRIIQDAASPDLLARRGEKRGQGSVKIRMLYAMFANRIAPQRGVHD